MVFSKELLEQFSPDYKSVHNLLNKTLIDHQGLSKSENQRLSLLIDLEKAKSNVSFLKVITQISNPKILELGCGDGHYLDYFFKNYTGEYFGIDPNKDKIDYALQNYAIPPTRTFQVAKAEDLSIETLSKYNIIIIHGCIPIFLHKLYLDIQKIISLLKNSKLSLKEKKDQYEKLEYFQHGKVHLSSFIEVIINFLKISPENHVFFIANYSDPLDFLDFNILLNRLRYRLDLIEIFFDSLFSVNRFNNDLAELKLVKR